MATDKISSITETQPAPWEFTGQADGMLIDYNVPIPMGDGIVLRGDVFRPATTGQYPVILTYGPYAKGLSFQQGYPSQWNRMVADHPDVARNSSNRYANWETVDPEKFVPHGYVCVRVDSRGTGCSPGYLDAWSPREPQDIYESVEWAASQPWSTGKVGMCGISYYAINQWLVAGLQPPHLAALIPWEGAGDIYRDVSYHGGIRCEFPDAWFPNQVATVQYGVGERAAKNPNTGQSVAGPVTLTDGQLAGNREDLVATLKAHPLDSNWYRDRSADWARVSVPFLSAANWGGQGLHPRGNFEAFTQAASEQKWLEAHGDTHWSLFYTDYAVALQQRFLDHFLKGEDNGWDREPRVRLWIRHPDEKFIERHENEWPLARTQWTKRYLDAGSRRLQTDPPVDASTAEYDATGEGVDFSFTVDRDTEITGPIAAKLFASSSSTDADLFLVVRVFDPDDQELTFQGALDPHTPIAQGWLRASHRKLDTERSLPYRPYHSHDEVQALTPTEVYELDVEIWPTCVVVPAGWRVTLTVRGKDYHYPGEPAKSTSGVGPFRHIDPDNRPADVFNGRVAVHTGGRRASYLLLPIIPAK